MFHVKHLLNQLTPDQRRQLQDFERLFLQVNATVNLVSRPSAARFRSEHVLDCLAFAQRILPAGAVVVDWGTGGGLPAVPLAVVFPQVMVYAVDVNQKKHYALRHFGRKLQLSNLQAWHGRAELFPYAVDYSVSRATAALDTLWSWHKRVARRSLASGLNQWSPGLLCRKGGELDAELTAMHKRFSGLAVEIVPVGSRQLVHVSQD